MILRMELQDDKGDVAGDTRGHCLQRLILGEIHFLEDTRQENQLVCQTERKRLFIN